VLGSRPCPARSGPDCARRKTIGDWNGFVLRRTVLSHRVGGSAVFAGTVAMFSAAGLTEAVRTYPTRPAMRLLVGRK